MRPISPPVRFGFQLLVAARQDRDLRVVLDKPDRYAERGAIGQSVVAGGDAGAVRRAPCARGESGK